MNGKNIAIVVGIFIILVAFFVFLQVSGILHKTATLKLQNDTIKLTVVSKSQDLQKGLSGRKSMPQNQGMLFLFTKADRYTFWMKNMEFPLDMIFVNDKRIVTIFSDVPKPANDSVSDSDLPKYTPTDPADKVIELNAGTAQKYNLHVGDTLDLSL